MNYPEFNVCLALTGEAVAIKAPNGEAIKAFMFRSRLYPRFFVFEAEETMGDISLTRHHELCLPDIVLGMWVGPVKAEPVKFDNWDALRTDINYMAKDANGMWFGCHYKPSPNERMCGWYMEESYPISALAGLPDVDWRHSLIKRPEGDEAE